MRLATSYGIFLAVLLSGCSHTRYEDDKRSEGYHKGQKAPLYAPLTELPFVPYPAGTEVGALILAGATLAANRDYYSKVALSGRCSYHASTSDTIDVPCSNVTILLLSEDGKELSRTQLTNGEFAFRVQPKIPYRLKAESAKLAMDPDFSKKKFFLGDDVVIHLTRAK